MAWSTHSRRVTALASCSVLLLACGDSGGREDSSATQSTVSATVTVSVSGTSNPTDATASATVGDSEAVTTGGSNSATEGQTTSGTTGTPVTATDVTSDTTPATEGSTGTGPCPAGQIECDGTTAKVCDGMGGFTSETPCAQACAPGLGCVMCVPGSHQCVGELSQVCSDDGTGCNLRSNASGSLSAGAALHGVYVDGYSGAAGAYTLGVTFGRVVTGRSPARGAFNWGVMIWHEISHVFAIHVSRSRVPSPPIGVTHETVTLEADASGAASRTVTLALRGARSNEYRPLAHYTVMVMAPASAAKLERTRAGAGLIGSRGEIPEYNRDAQRFMAAMWAVGRDADEEDAPAADADRMTRDRYAYTQLVSAGKVARIEVHSRPNNPAIAIAAPDTTAPGAPFTVAVTVRNPTGRPIDNLAIQLDSLAGMIGEGFAETNYRGLAVDAIQVEGDGAHSRSASTSIICATSLSPRPDRLISTVRPASSARARDTQARAWADSRAGMIPSVRLSSTKASTTSSSVTGS